MKILKKIVIALAVIFLFVYYGQTIKAQKVKAVRLKTSYQEGKLPKGEYERLIQQNTYLKTFLNPKEVLSVD